MYISIVSCESMHKLRVITKAIEQLEGELYMHAFAKKHKSQKQKAIRCAINIHHQLQLPPTNATVHTFTGAIYNTHISFENN